MDETTETLDGGVRATPTQSPEAHRDDVISRLILWTRKQARAMQNATLFALTADASQRSLRLARQSGVGGALEFRTLRFEDHGGLLTLLAQWEGGEPKVVTRPFPWLSSLAKELDIFLA